MNAECLFPNICFSLDAAIALDGGKQNGAGGGGFLCVILFKWGWEFTQTWALTCADTVLYLIVIRLVHKIAI